MMVLTNALLTFIAIILVFIYFKMAFLEGFVIGAYERYLKTRRN